MTEKKLLINYRAIYLVDILLYVIFQTILVTFFFTFTFSLFPVIWFLVILFLFIFISTFTSLSYIFLFIIGFIFVTLNISDFFISENWAYYFSTFFFRVMCAMFYVKKLPIFSKKYKEKIEEWKVRGKTVGKNVGILK